MGTWWCDFHTGRWYEGGQEIEVDAPLERIPLFVADGGMIPFGPIMRYVGERPDDTREVYAFGRASASLTLFEDDGETFAYRDGHYTALRLSLDLQDDQFVPRAEILHSGYTLPYDHVTFIMATLSTHTLAGGVYADERWHVTVPISR
jgi:alpha-glucosidase (family GH31 glycosyl hydrolase)